MKLRVQFQIIYHKRRRQVHYFPTQPYTYAEDTEARI
jgi:hypothetical protein